MIALFIAALLAASCSSLVASEGGRCKDFLNSGGIKINGDLVSFDIDKDYSLSPDAVGTVYNSLHGMGSGCRPFYANAVAADELGLSGDAPLYKDIGAGFQDGRVWVQFVYPSLGEYGPGLTSDITFYTPNGEPKSSVVVSSYHSWEGAQTMSSTMSGGKIVRCTRSIEFFSYTQSGDIDEELPEPVRSQCEVSQQALP